MPSGGVGSGTGGLTSRLAAQAAAVLSVEVDPAFYSLAAETVAGKQNLTMLHRDILRRKNELDPEVFHTAS